MTRESSNPFTLLRRKPRLRAVMPACTKRFGLPAVQGLWQADEGRPRAFRPWMPALRSSCRYSYGGGEEDGSAMEGYPSKLLWSVVGYASEGFAPKHVE